MLDGLPAAQRGWAAAAIFTALAMASLDTAIANIALPAIAADLHVGPADVIWVVNVYQIALVATLLPLAALGEIVGHHRIYLGGLLLFTIASLACACAWSLPSLLVARALQGLGASGIMSVNTALVRHVYPGRLAGRGFGHNAMVVATAFTLGPTIASGILALGPWTWLFAVNIPFGLVAMLIGLKTLPRTPRATHAFDFPGALLAAGCLGLLMLGVGSAAHHAQPTLVFVELAAAVLLGWMVIRRQADHPAPMLPVDLFRKPLFALSTATAICSFAVQGPRLRLAAVLFRGHSRPHPGRDRLLHDAMAAGGRDHGADRRTPVRSLTPPESSAASASSCSASAWRSWRCCRRPPHIADIVWRMALCGCWLRFLPGAEHEGDHVQRAGRPQRRRQRHRGDGAAESGRPRARHWRRCASASSAAKAPPLHWCWARRSQPSDA